MLAGADITVCIDHRFGISSHIPTIQRPISQWHAHACKPSHQLLSAAMQVRNPELLSDSWRLRVRLSHLVGQLAGALLEVEDEGLVQDLTVVIGRLVRGWELVRHFDGTNSSIFCVVIAVSSIGIVALFRALLF